MKEIPLTQGKVALVDDEDYVFLMQWKWYAQRLRRAGRNEWYASRGVQFNRQGKQVRLHIAMQNHIMGIHSPYIVDHRDGNTLNNQKDNLRVTDPHGNSWNQRKRAATSSKYKGVYFRPDRGKWHASCGRTFLGLFDTEEEAGKAYDAEVRKKAGEFACVNFPKGVERCAL